MLSNHLILCQPLLLLPSVFTRIQWVDSSHQATKVLKLQLQHQSFQWTIILTSLNTRNTLLWKNKSCRSTCQRKRKVHFQPESETWSHISTPETTPIQSAGVTGHFILFIYLWLHWAKCGDLESNLWLLQWKLGVLTTGPSGKSLFGHLKVDSREILKTLFCIKETSHKRLHIYDSIDRK